MAKLTKIKVWKLLGQFNHEISMPAEWDFTILYGPNGIGKTKLLELVEAMAKQQFRRLDNIPFERAELSFSDGATLVATREDSTDDDEEQLERSTRLVTLTLNAPGLKSTKWNSASMHPRAVLVRLRELEMRGIPVVRAGRNTWIDQLRGDEVSGDELLARYSDYLPGKHKQVVGYKPPTPEARVFMESLSVHLIETQRLLNTKRSENAPGVSQRDHVDQSTVVRFAEDLAQRLRDAMTENSRVSQKLDSSFPRRVLEVTTKGDPLTDEKIRQRYADQSELREQLAEIAVLDAAPEVPLPARPLETWERSFLWKYLDDTDTKLESFTPLLRRAQLFRDIVNSRFLFKKMRIDRSHGFIFTTDAGHDIPATALSSGEQHEIVLAYNLLFMVEPGGLVLIDEPEISLHVTWQQDFISDLRKISDITSLRFIIATHSPQVIHHWTNRARALGPFTLESGKGAVESRKEKQE